jgi:uncharacterized protein (DUF697 family)
MAETVEKTTLDNAQDIVRKNTYWAAGVGLIPIPIVDLAGVTVVQLKMLNELCKLYEVPFLEEKGKNLISALIGGVTASGLAAPVGSVVKMVPLIGSVLGAVTMPTLSGAATFAVGKVFIQHFECGGTLLTFDPEKVRAYFEKELQEGKKVVAKK